MTPEEKAALLRGMDTSVTATKKAPPAGGDPNAPPTESPNAFLKAINAVNAFGEGLQRRSDAAVSGAASLFGGDRFLPWLAEKVGGEAGAKQAQKQVIESQAEHPAFSTAGKLAGGLATGMGVSAGVGRALPALAKPGLLSTVGNQALTGVLTGAAEEAATKAGTEEGMSLTRPLIEGGVSGAFGAGGHMLSNLVDPTKVVRSLGDRLRPEQLRDIGKASRTPFTPGAEVIERTLPQALLAEGGDRALANRAQGLLSRSADVSGTGATKDLLSRQEAGLNLTEDILGRNLSQATKAAEPARATEAAARAQNYWKGLPDIEEAMRRLGAESRGGAIDRTELGYRAIGELQERLAATSGKRHADLQRQIDKATERLGRKATTTQGERAAQGELDRLGKYRETLEDVAQIPGTPGVGASVGKATEGLGGLLSYLPGKAKALGVGVEQLGKAGQGTLRPGATEKLLLDPNNAQMIGAMHFLADRFPGLAGMELAQAARHWISSGTQDKTPPPWER